MYRSNAENPTRNEFLLAQLVPNFSKLEQLKLQETYIVFNFDGL